MNIIYISLHLTESGLKESIKEFHCDEKPNSYKVAKASNFGGKTTMVKKEEILKVDSMVRENLYNTIHAYTWCFEHNLVVAKRLLNAQIREVATRQYKVAQLMYSHFI